MIGDHQQHCIFCSTYLNVIFILDVFTLSSFYDYIQLVPACVCQVSIKCDNVQKMCVVESNVVRLPGDDKSTSFSGSPPSSILDPRSFQSQEQVRSWTVDCKPTNGAKFFLLFFYVIYDFLFGSLYSALYSCAL